MARPAHRAQRDDMTIASIGWNPAATNQRFYEALWSRARLTSPERFNTWPLLSRLSTTRRRRVELGPGLHPRLPLDETLFIDGSAAAVSGLRDAGADALRGDLTALPLENASVDLACAFDVIEHVGDDETLLAEVSRVLANDGVFVMSVPLHPHRWTEFDGTVGHIRRYEPRALIRMLARHEITVIRSACFGMKPADGWLTRLALRQLNRHFDEAMDWYNRWLMPIALWRQKPLQFAEGLADPCAFDDVVLHCRRIPRTSARTRCD